MRVLALNFGDRTCASSYYRVWQYRDSLRELAIELSAIPAAELSPAQRLQDFDAVLVQKKLFSASRVRRIRTAAKRLIYDLDDAIWAPQRRQHHFLTQLRTHYRLRAICRAADVCIAANSLLALKLQRFGGTPKIIPMALDETVWRARESRSGQSLRIGWSGGPANLPFLHNIDGALAEVQKDWPAVEFAIHCGQRPAFKSGLRFTHVPYEPGQEPAVVRSFDIGLAPLPDTEFAAGKTPIKCLQYMASGVAAVVSPVGATRAMFVEGKTAMLPRTLPDWRQAITTLLEDAKFRAGLAANGRAEFEATYTLRQQTHLLAHTLRSAE